MKILHAVLRYYPAMGGVEEYLRQLLEGLADRGHELQILTSTLRYERCGRLDQALPVVGGVKVRRYAPFPLKPKGYVVIPGLVTDLCRAEAQIIHGHAYMHFPADAACWAARRRRIPFVFNPFFVDVGRDSCWRRWYKRHMGRRLLAADAVVAISAFEEMMLAHNGLMPRRLERISPGVVLEEFEKPTENIYQRYHLQGPVVLYVGRLDYYKGVDVLLRAVPLVLKEIPEARFVLAGPDWGYRATLEQLAADLKIADKLIFAGALSRQELVSAYTHASVFAFPSRYELFGIVLIEAMAAGLPVVTTDTSAMPFIVEHQKTGLLCRKDDFQDLSRQILRLLKDTQLAKALAESGRQEVGRRYSLAQQVQKLEGLYQSLLN